MRITVYDSVALLIDLVVVALEMNMVGEPAERGHVDAVLCIWIGMAKVDSNALATAVDDGDAFGLECLGLEEGSVSAVATVSDGARRGDDAVPGDGRVLEEL